MRYSWRLTGVKSDGWLRVGQVQAGECSGEQRCGTWDGQQPTAPRSSSVTRTVPRLRAVQQGQRPPHLNSMVHLPSTSL